LKVFIVDDSALVRKRLRSLLEDIGEVELVGEAEDCAEAIDAIPKARPDVVILDIHMPGGSGIEVLKEIKKGEPSPLVIMLTDYPSLQYRKICQELGASYFFDKLTEFEKVAEVLKGPI